jgi:hypothetical protein
MKKLLASAALLGAIAIPAAAQDNAAPAAQAAPVNQADVARGMTIYRTFATVIRSEEAEQMTKRRLLSCMYNNSVQQISVATGRVLAANPNLDATKPAVVYAVAAGGCGVKPKAQTAN